MKKILVIAAGFFPGMNYGGPPVSIDNFCSLFKDYRSYIVTRDHDNGSNERYKNISDGWNDRGNCKVQYLTDKQYKYKNFLQICRKVKPDWIYLQGLFQSCIIPSLFVSKKENKRVLLAVRGELCEGAFRKKWKKIPYIALIRLMHLIDDVEFQSTSAEETDAIQRWLHVKKDCIHYLPNLPTIPTTVKEYEGKKENGKARFVFISRIVPKKNLLYAFERLNNIKGEVIFDIYGVAENKDYWEKCLLMKDSLPPNIMVEYCGVIEHDNVIDTFSKYDAFIFPTLSENYGHVIVEALLAGCPVITSQETPWREMKKCGAGWDIKLSDKKAFEGAIQSIVDMDDDKMRKMRSASCNYIRSKLEIDRIEQDYRNLIEG